MKSPVIAVAGACLLFALSGCMNMSGLSGESKYACKAPEGVACDSVSGTYANAIHHNLPGQRPAPSVGPEASKVATTMTQRSKPQPTAASATAGDGSFTAVSGPLRSQAHVLRLWIKPWEDADGDLFDQGFVYVKVDNGEWLIDHVQQQIRKSYAPLRPPKLSADTNADPTGSTGTPFNLPLPRPSASGNAFPALQPAQGSGNFRSQ